MSDSSRVRVSIVSESSYGVTPASPAFLVLPITGVSMKDRVGYVQSNVINSSRDVEDMARLSRSAGGGIPIELRYSPTTEGLGVALTGMLCSTWTAATTQVTSVTSSSGVLSASGIETGIEVGDIVRVRDGSDALLAYARVSAVGAGSITLETGHGVADGSSRKVLRGARMKNGTTTPSFSVEVAYLDLQKAVVYTGCVFATADMTVALGSLATIVFSLEGKTSTHINSNTGTPDQFIASATYTAAATHPSLDPIGVTTLKVGAAAYAASSVAVSWDNNVRAREQLGTLGPTSMARGQFGVSGRASAYFETFTDHTTFVGNTATDMWFVMIDANNRGYSVSYPQAKFTDIDTPVNSNNADIFKAIALAATKDPTELCSMRLQVWAG
ncbi:MAG: phage tail tube protein [Planctomycetota bacterium]